MRIRDHVWVWLVPFFLPLAFYYLQFVFNAPETHVDSPQPLSGIVQIAYYFTGFGGLGWSRNTLRTMQLGLTWRLASELGLGLAAWLALGIFAVRSRAFKNRMATHLLVAILATLACFIATNIVLKTRFWERHVIYLLPGLALVLAMVCDAILEPRPSRAARAAVILFLSAHLLSGLNTIALEYYQKDDNRGALRLARAMAPDHIFFQGCEATFGYYGLVPSLNADGTEIQGELVGDADISGATPEQLSALLARTSGSVVLILSEKTKFDKGGLYGMLTGSVGSVQFVNFFAVVAEDSAVRKALEEGASPGRDAGAGDGNAPL